jgi:hypothetical protein
MSGLRLKATPMCKNLIVINGGASRISGRLWLAAARFTSADLNIGTIIRSFSPNLNCMNSPRHTTPQGHLENHAALSSLPTSRELINDFIKVTITALFGLTIAIALAEETHGYTVSGNTYTTNGSQSDVQAACAAAPDNGSVTVLIPNGKYSWTGTLTISNAVNLQGASQAGVIIDNNNATSDMILVNGSANAHTTISNITIVDVAGNGGGVAFSLDLNRNINSSYTDCIYNCTFNCNGIYTWMVRCMANGIIFWSDTFIGTGSEGIGGISFVCDQYGYTSSWNTPDSMGTNDTTGLMNSYVEDCTFYDATTGGCNFDDNSRVVWRYNTMNNSCLASHGQETSVYGVRQWEVYNNTFILSGSGTGPSGATYPLNWNYWFECRGGTGIWTNNVMPDFSAVGYDGKSGVQLNVFSITRGMNDGIGGVFCPLAYPAPHQTGWGWSSSSSAYWGIGDDTNPSELVGGASPGAFAPDGQGATLDPIYVWNNTGAMTSDPGYVATQTYLPDNCGDGEVIATFLQEGREYYVNVASPTWSPYTYPHPLHTSFASGNPTATPTPRATPTPTPTPTPTSTSTPTPTPVSVPTPTPGPAAPIITSSSSTSRSVTLTWEEADTAPGWYKIYYGTPNGDYAVFYNSPTSYGASAASVSATINGLDPGTTYYFAVQYFVSPGASDPSPFSAVVAVQTAPAD